MSNCVPPCFCDAPSERRTARRTLLERRREQASRRWPGGAAACAVSRRDQFLAGGGLAQGDRGVRRGRRRAPDTGAVPGGSLRDGRRRCVDRSASSAEMRLRRPRQWGACWLAGQCGGNCSSTGSGPIACRQPERDAVGPSAAGAGHLSADCARQRMAAASPMVRQQRHGRSAGRGLRPRRSAQALCLSRPAART